MKVTHDHHEFYRTTGMIIMLPRVKQLGLITDDVGATFWPNEMDDVLDFCAKNPQFHIVTYLGEGIFVNRYDERGLMFQLAEGDADPEYMLNILHFYEWILPTKDAKERLG